MGNEQGTPMSETGLVSEENIGRWSGKTRGIWWFTCCNMEQCGLQTWEGSSCPECGELWSRPPLRDLDREWNKKCEVCGEPATYLTSGTYLCEACELPDSILGRDAAYELRHRD